MSTIICHRLILCIVLHLLVLRDSSGDSGGGGSGGDSGGGRGGDSGLGEVVVAAAVLVVGALIF